MDYTELFTQVKGYLEADFDTVTFTDVAGTGTITLTGDEQIDQFIRQAETRIYNSVQFPSLRKRYSGQLTANSQYLTLQTDFIAPYSFAVATGVTGGDIDTGTYSYLLNKDIEFIRESYPAKTDTGVPQHYAIFGSISTTPITTLRAILGPTPDSSYYYEMHYFYHPESIVDAATGNTWLSINFDPVLLYGTLVEAYTFLKGEPDMLKQYMDKYTDALAMAKRLGDGLDRGDTYRDSQAKIPVK